MSAFSLRTWLAVGWMVSLLAATPAVAAPDGKTTKTEKTKSADKAEAAPLPPVAALIDGDPLFVAEVETMLDAVVKSRALKTKENAQVKADMLSQLIDRRLALLAMQKEGGYFTDAEIDKALLKLKPPAGQPTGTMEQFAAQRGVTPDVFRKEVAWQLGWERYLERNLSAGLEDYFKEHHLEFDGTQVHARHIVLRPDRSGETNAQLVERAKKIRADIEAGKLTFEQAAEKYSAGPSREHGGDVGFIPRHGVMVEDFSKVAFALEKGVVSEPAISPFGVHLIRVDEIKPGNRQWTEVVNQLKPRASADLFDKLVEKIRPDVKIEFTGKMPHFKPGTKEVVMPGGAGP